MDEMATIEAATLILSEPASSLPSQASDFCTSPISSFDTKFS
jgi:hypothetical protein